ncbi:peptidoglycan D,D-transpeptidase FtsI family protein [Propionimicrobium lymphophilum]|uniref:peptidoglycan D,D-transpeptidase FtsI family protein n=1 Tax=Propionimicrobium lymphophilum TaxID=33012 RepID=UPI00068405FB|nr:penicillin-binding protein 2 [Propionimicrobium lymphophilum]
MRLKLASSARRINVFIVLFAMAISVLAWRAISIQGIDANANAQAAAEKLTQTKTIKAKRGELVDRNGVVLAQSQPAFSVIADPTSISTNGYNPASMTDEQAEKAKKAPEAIADILISYLGGKKDEYLPKLENTTNEDGTPNRYVVIKRKVSADIYRQMAEKLKEGGWYGVYSVDDPVRYYPNGTLASSVLGYTNFEGDGAMGLEGSLNDKLAGVDGKQTFQRSAYGTIPLGENTLKPAEDGVDYQLTIDSELQLLAEQQLNKTVRDTEALGGSVVVMSSKTGEVLAMANNPTFDPNEPGKADTSHLGNKAVSDVYEPGSVEKVLTAAALLDAGLISPDTQVQVPAQISSGGGYIRDAWGHGTEPMTVRGVIAHSSNIGTVQLARLMDKQQLSDYLHSFGLGSPTGIEVVGEQPQMGIVPDGNMADYTRDQISFGQGLSVSALQMTTALASVTNGGVYHAPTLLKSATDANGKNVEIARKEPRRVVSEEASKQLVDIMEAEIASPEILTSPKKKMPGYRVGGKSGTAQKVGANGGYDGTYIASYAMVAPVEDPQFVVYVMVDRPRKGIYGEAVAFPVAKNLMQYLLPRYGVLPQEAVPEYSQPLSY